MEIRATEYREALIATTPISAQEFISGNHDAEIIRRIQEIISVESPVMDAVLTKRLINSFGLQQLGNRLHQKLYSLLEAMDLPTTTQSQGVVFWDAAQDMQYFHYRTCDEEYKRYSYQIPLCEIINAMTEAAASSSTRFISKGDLYTNTSHLLGYRRKGASVRAILDEALDSALATGKLQRSGNGKITCP